MLGGVVKDHPDGAFTQLRGVFAEPSDKPGTIQMHGWSWYATSRLVMADQTAQRGGDGTNLSLEFFRQ